MLSNVMVFLLVSIIVPVLLVLGLPAVLRRRYGNDGKVLLLYIACLTFFIAWYVPSPLIDGRNTAFMTHLIGGGIFSGLLWNYIKSVVLLRLTPIMDALILFGVVSSLGVMNELFELVVVRIGVAHLTLEDTSWDLLANTLGAAIVYGLTHMLSVISVKK